MFYSYSDKMVDIFWTYERWSNEPGNFNLKHCWNLRISRLRSRSMDSTLVEKDIDFQNERDQMEWRKCNQIWEKKKWLNEFAGKNYIFPWCLLHFLLIWSKKIEVWWMVEKSPFSRRKEWNDQVVIQSCEESDWTGLLSKGDLLRMVWLRFLLIWSELIYKYSLKKR